MNESERSSVNAATFALTSTHFDTTQLSALSPLATIFETYVPGSDIYDDEAVLGLRRELLRVSAEVRTLLDTLTTTISVTNTEVTHIKLSDVHPNWDQLTSQFLTFLATKDAWKDTYLGSIGTTLAEMIASVGAWNQQGIEVAAREAFLSTAVRDSSVYAAAAMMGVHITRKNPANVSVTLVRNDFQTTTLTNVVLDTTVEIFDTVGVPITLAPENVVVSVSGTTLVQTGGAPSGSQYRVLGATLVFGPDVIDKQGTITYRNFPDVVTLPRGTTFSIGGGRFFNREPIVFEPEITSVTTFLFEGWEASQTFAPQDQEFAVYTLAVGQFSVSDSDIEVRVPTPGTQTYMVWQKTPNLWMMGPTDTVWLDRTTPTGLTQVILGNGVHGARLAATDTVTISYYVTSGSAANRMDVGTSVTCGNSAITGTTLSNIAGGSDEKPASYYQIVAPYMYDSRYSLTTSEHFRAHLLNRPNVSDVVIRAQKDIAPDNIRWMNMVRICMLPTNGDRITDAEWQDHLSYLYAHGPLSLRYSRLDPQRIDLSVNINVFIFDHVRASDVRTQIRDSVVALFSKHPGCLGRMVAISDIVAAAQISGQTDYIEVLINGDARDVPMPNVYTWAHLRSLNIQIDYSNRQSRTEWSE